MVKLKPFHKDGMIKKEIVKARYVENKNWIVFLLSNMVEVMMITPVCDNIISKNRKATHHSELKGITVKDIGWENNIYCLFIVDTKGDVYRINCRIDDGIPYERLFNYTVYKRDKADSRRKKKERKDKIKYWLSYKRNSYEMI